MTYSLRGSYTRGKHSTGRHLPQQPRQLSRVSMTRSKSCMPKIRPRSKPLVDLVARLSMGTAQVSPSWDHGPCPSSFVAFEHAKDFGRRKGVAGFARQPGRLAREHRTCWGSPRAVAWLNCHSSPGHTGRNVHPSSGSAPVSVSCPLSRRVN